MIGQTEAVNSYLFTDVRFNHLWNILKNHTDISINVKNSLLFSSFHVDKGPRKAMNNFSIHYLFCILFSFSILIIIQKPACNNVSLG